MCETSLTLFSRQIRPPIYTIKQSRLRKRRVIRYASLYFFLLIVFILLFFGPLIVSRFIDLGSFGTIPLDLMQPTGQNNNDTFSSITGSALVNFGQGAAAATGGGGGGGGDDSAASSSAGGDAVFSFGGRMAVRWATVA